MRLSHVEMMITQSDLQAAINEWLPEGFSIANLHVATGGACATCLTPKLKADVNLRIRDASLYGETSANREESGAHAADRLQGGEIRVEVEFSKWVPLPQFVVHQVLERLVPDDMPGMRLEGTNVLVNLAQLLKPWADAGSVMMRLSDGEVMLQAYGVTIAAQGAPVSAQQLA